MEELPTSYVINIIQKEEYTKPDINYLNLNNNLYRVLQSKEGKSQLKKLSTHCVTQLFNFCVSNKFKYTYKYFTPTYCINKSVNLSRIILSIHKLNILMDISLIGWFLPTICMDKEKFNDILFWDNMENYAESLDSTTIHNSIIKLGKKEKTAAACMINMFQHKLIQINKFEALCSEYAQYLPYIATYKYKKETIKELRKSKHFKKFIKKYI